MPTVTGLTKEAILALHQESLDLHDLSVASGVIDTKGHLVLTTAGGDSQDLGNVIAQRFNILDYGAAEDNPDNRAAIQAALTAAGAVGGAVYVPIGVFPVKATANRTFSIPANVSVVGEDRNRSIVRVTANSGDWAYLFCYPSTGSCDNVTFRNLTIDGSANVNPSTTGNDWTTTRCLINTMGANVTVQDCNLLSNGIWAIKHVGDNFRCVNNNVTVDMSAYTLGWFDQSVIWFFSQNGRCTENTFTVKEATSNNFVVQTAIEFQGHRNSVKGNKSSPGTKFTRAVIVTASTYFAGLTNFYPASPKGASDNVIEENQFTVQRWGVEIWGMVVASPVDIKGLRIRRNVFDVDNTGWAFQTGGVNIYVGTVGAPGNDGPQTSGISDLKITDNVVRYVVRRVATPFLTADAAFRLITETSLTGCQVSNNKVSNCGGFGVIMHVDTAAGWVDGVDVVGENVFTDVREPVRVGRNVRNWRVEGNSFEQYSSYATFNDNMLETVANRANDYTSETGGIVRRNTIRTLTGHRPFYPIRDQGVAQSVYPAARDYIVEQMGAQMQAPGVTVTVGSADVVRRASDGTFVKAQFAAGATLGTVTPAVTIASVIDTTTMTVSTATHGLKPGEVISLPYNAPFSSGSAVILAVIGNTIRVGANQLAITAGHNASEAVGYNITYYSAVVAA